MKLWLLRHANAGLPGTDAAKELTRPLTPLGVSQIQAVADQLAKDKEFPSYIYTSELKRAMDTAFIVARTLGAPVMVIDDIGPQLPLHRIVKSLVRYQELKRVMIVGHHDNFEPFVEWSGAGKKSDLFVTAEVRRFKIDRDTLQMVEKYRVTPADVGQPNTLGFGNAVKDKTA